MEIAFSSEQLRQTCNDSKALKRRFGAEGEKLIRRRLDELQAAPTLAAIAKLPGPRCEELKGGRAGQLSVRVQGGFRLVFIPVDDPPAKKPDGGLDWVAVRAIKVLEIEDYHA